jgi:hypothetical protein
MARRTVIALSLLAGISFRCRAQDLTVHMIDETSKQPVGNALIRLHYGCWHSMKPVELKERTDSNGVAIFKSVSLSPLEFCVFPDYEYASQEKAYVFTSPEDAQSHSKTLDIEKVSTALPANITFHVRRYTLAEQIKTFFDHLRD